jgi:hypothetical protein
MRIAKVFRTALTLAALAAPALGAQAAGQAPKAGWRAEFLKMFGDDEQKFVQLANATPWEKFAWRPGKDVRSTCEVFLHIAGDNYLLAEPLGAKKPASVDYKTIESCPAGKEAVIATMKASFAHFRGAVLATPDTDGDAMIEFFGSRISKRGLLFAVAGHTGEHLGQSIAYARTNGIVPPWSQKPAR